MQSYSAARGYFSFIGTVAWSAIILGVILALAGGSAVSRGGLMGSLLAAAPGIILVMIGCFILVNVQTARATVDSAEYAQQSLKLSRDQFELSKQMLALAQPGKSSTGYTTTPATSDLQNVSFDTAAPTGNAAAVTSPLPTKTHQYANTIIEERSGQFFIKDKPFDTLREAHLAINQPRPAREKVRLEAS